MAYKNIDLKRYGYLLREAKIDHELRQFYKECRPQLIHKGAKVRNEPRGIARVQTLVELPQSTEKVVQAWFAKHLKMLDPVTVEKIVQEYKTCEESDGNLSKDTEYRLARSCLVHLFSDDPSQLLLDFLKTPIYEHEKRNKIETVNVDIMPEEASSNPYPDKLPDVFIDLMEGRDVDEHLAGFPSDLATFITGLQSARLGNMDLAREALSVLPAHSKLSSPLEKCLIQIEARQGSKEAIPRGLNMIDPENFEGEFDNECDEVVAYCTKADSPNAVFVHPIAVICNSRIQLLSGEKRQQLFPESGDIMAFTGPKYPPQPRRGEIGVWRVEEQAAVGKTRFHLVSPPKGPVYEVKEIPTTSTDYDSVRELLRKEYVEQPNGGSLQPLLFKLADGLILGGRTNLPDLSKDETYELGLRSWSSLPAILFEGRTFVVGPLPKEHGVYECASLASTVKLLFKKRKEGGNTTGGLTKEQIRELAQSLNTTDAEVDPSRIQRIKAQLERLAEHQGAFDSLVNELMSNQSIIERIDQLVEQEVSKLIDSKNNLKEDIARLQNERGEWEERVRKQREELGKIPQNIANAMKTRFEKARADGAATLADLAIFQILTASSQNTTPNFDRSNQDKGSFSKPITRELSTSDGEAVSILRAFGVPSKQATSLVLVCETAFRAGLMVCVRGIAARPVVEGWARTLQCRGILIDSTVGLIDDSTVKDVLVKAPHPGVVTILDANLSALDIYAKSLLDLVLARAVEPIAKRQPAIFLALTDSVGSLPLPKAFEQVSVLIDLDKRYKFRSVAEIDDLMSDVFNPEDEALNERLWQPIAVCLQQQINELEPEHQALVLSVLSSN